MVYWRVKEAATVVEGGVVGARVVAAVSIIGIWRKSRGGEDEHEVAEG